MRYFLGLWAFFTSITLHATNKDSLATGGFTRRENKLGEVTVAASDRKAKEYISNAQMGRVNLPVAMLLKAPAIGGEQDVIKALQLTPGVKRGTEGTVGMYVRGGGNDENLIMLDGAPVYNAGHLLGFFSVFNSASLQDVQLLKSAFPAQYGGRLSSVMDVTTKQGSLSEYSATASIGLISSAASVQGPILKDRLSGIVSARRTYVDKVFRYIPYHFYDLNAKLSFVADKRNRFYLSSYHGADVLRVQEAERESMGQKELQSGMNMGNTTGSLRWNHISGNNRYATDLTAIYSRFGYDISGRLGSNSLSMKSAIRDYGLNGQIRWYGSSKHKVSSGFQITRHFFNPNMVQSSGAPLEQYGDRGGQKIYNTEAALYVQDEYALSKAFQLSMGLRISSSFVRSKTYLMPEPRLATRFLLNEHSSIKFSYARMVQYLHLVSSSSLALPTDLWYPVSDRIRPGVSDQLSAGYYHLFPATGWSFNMEGYHKWMHHIVEYREGAQLVLNDDYEDELVHGTGRSYGVEFFLSKTTGRFTGWVGYTLSYANRKFDSLNKGQTYAARYDRRHDLSLVGMYELSKRWAVSTAIVYATGSPFTGQTGQYAIPKPDLTGVEIVPIFSGRNAMRLSSSFRVDFDLQYRFVMLKRIRCDAHLSMYNAFNRAQPGRVTREWDEGSQSFVYRQKGLFGNITTLAINFNI